MSGGSPSGKLLPRSFDITSADGEHAGSIEGQFSLNATDEINIGDTHGAPREAIVAAAMVIDAIEATDLAYPGGPNAVGGLPTGPTADEG